MKNKISKYIIKSIITNSFLFILKIIMGIIFNVHSLVADAFHSLSDIIIDLVAFLGNKISKKEPNYKHPKGYGKLEYITSLIISFFIIVLSINILKESFNCSNTIPNIYVSIVLVITIILKLLLSRYLISKGKKLNNMILISSGSESHMDVYSSVLVLITILLAQFSNKISILKYSDMISTIIIGILIFITGIKILIRNISLLIDEVENNEEIINKIKEIISDRKGNFKLNSILLLKNGGFYEISIVISMKKNIKLYRINKFMDNLEKDLIESNLNIKFVHLKLKTY